MIPDYCVTMVPELPIGTIPLLHDAINFDQNKWDLYHKDHKESIGTYVNKLQI